MKKMNKEHIKKTLVAIQEKKDEQYSGIASMELILFKGEVCVVVDQFSNPSEKEKGLIESYERNGYVTSYEWINTGHIVARVIAVLE